MTDAELLQRFAATGSADAFSELVTRHAPAVYAAARRQLPDPSEADDITQAVFLVLARRAPHLPPGVILSSWLLKTTYLACCQARRTVARRRKHEQRAAAMRPTSAPAVELSELSPILDAALASLSDSDRSAILLRYLEQKSVDEVSRVLGVSSETAQKRISRAIARLRKLLGVGGPALSASSLAAFFTTHGQHAVPQAVLHQIMTLPGTAAAAGISTTAVTLSKGVLKTMLWLKIKLIGAAALATLAIGTTGTLVAQQALAPARPPATVPSTTLAGTASGVTVEAVALTVADNKTTTLWKPDGSPAGNLPVDTRAPFAPFPNMKYRAVALRIAFTGAPPDDLSMRPAPAMDDMTACAWTNPSRVNGQLFSYITVMAPATQPSATLRVEVATGPWNTRVRTPSFDGGLLGAPNGVPGGAGVAGGVTSQATDNAVVSSGIASNHGVVYTISDALGSQQDYRVIGTDGAGMRHTATVFSTGGTHLAQITATFPNLRPEDIREIRYETRPYTDYVEFSNLALDPGTATRPHVTTGKINPGIIAADNPGEVGEYYIGGHVNRVGVYSLTGRQITLKQAVVSAGMPTIALEETRVDLIRRLPGNKERFTTIDLDAVFKGTQPDRYLQPNDLIQLRPKTPATAPANPK